MQQHLNDLTGFTLSTRDGEIGKLSDCYFDDTSWTIRYLVVDTGGWLNDRKVLITPTVVEGIDPEQKTIVVNLSRAQVQNSPEIDTARPVSRQKEIELYEHYGWPFNSRRGLTFYGGIGMTGMTETRMPFEESIAEQNQETEEDPHLRSVADLKGNAIQALDGEFGNVEDSLIDEDWKIKFIVVDTGKWISGKKVLMAPRWIERISWEDSNLQVSIPIESIRNCPEYRDEEEVHEMYQQNLYHYYGKPIE